MEVNKLIHTCAATDYALKCRIGQNDLVAYEAHYHKSCRLTALRKCESGSGSAVESSDDPKKAAFTKLVAIISHGLKNGCVYSMDDVCSKYCQLLAVNGHTDASCRSHSMKERLSNHFGNAVSFRRQRNMNQPLLTFPNVSSGVAVEALKDVTDTLQETDILDETLQSPHHFPSFWHSLFHVATKIHADLKVTPGHSGFDNLNQEAMEKCIPDSLYMLMKWILTPPDALEEIGEWDEEKNKGGNRHQKILQECQNIVYLASNGRKTGLFASCHKVPD